MPLIRYHPCAPLDRYVECIWWSWRERAEIVGEHMLPSGILHHRTDYTFRR